jgi:hypothetical protein
VAGEQPQTLAELVAAFASGLRSWARSPAVQRFVELSEAVKGMDKDQAIAYISFKKVKPDAMIEVEGFDEPIDLVRLRRTIGNLAITVGEVREWIASVTTRCIRGTEDC